MEVRTHIRIMKQSALTSEAHVALVEEMLIWLLKLMFRCSFKLTNSVTKLQDQNQLVY
jgi:hypothetical protein